MPTYRVNIRAVMRGTTYVEADDSESAKDAVANFEDIDDHFRENADLTSAMAIGDPEEMK